MCASMSCAEAALSTYACGAQTCCICVGTAPFAGRWEDAFKLCGPAISASVGGADSYGDRATRITRLAEERRLGRRLVRGHPMIEAEVVWAVREELCETACDFIARRTRLAFVDTAACEQALPRVRSLRV